jgi:hypothetical protein
MKNLKSYQQFTLNEGVIDTVKRILPGGKEFYENQLIILDIINSIDLGPGVKILREKTDTASKFTIKDFVKQREFNDLFSSKSEIGFTIKYQSIYITASKRSAGFTIINSSKRGPLIHFFIQNQPSGFEKYPETLYKIKGLLKTETSYNFDSEIFKTNKDHVINSIEEMLQWKILVFLIESNPYGFKINLEGKHNIYKLINDFIQKNIKYTDKEDTTKIVCKKAKMEISRIIYLATVETVSASTMVTATVGLPTPLTAKSGSIGDLSGITSQKSDRVAERIAAELSRLDECDLDIEYSKLIEHLDIRHKIISKLSENHPEVYKKLKAQAPEEDSWKVDINKDLGDLGF